MKNLFLLALLCIAVLASNCSSKTASKTAKMEERSKPKITYAANIKDLLAGSCSPCHYADQGGKKKSLATIADVKAVAMDVSDRISMAPDQKGFMPFMSKKPPLTPDQVKLFKDWVAAGMPE